MSFLDRESFLDRMSFFDRRTFRLSLVELLEEERDTDYNNGENITHDESVQILGQIAVPIYKKMHSFDPDFIKCDNKIVKYSVRRKDVWKVSMRLNIIHNLYDFK